MSEFHMSGRAYSREPNDSGVRESLYATIKGVAQAAFPVNGWQQSAVNIAAMMEITDLQRIGYERETVRARDEREDLIAGRAVRMALERTSDIPARGIA